MTIQAKLLHFLGTCTIQPLLPQLLLTDCAMLARILASSNPTLIQGKRLQVEAVSLFSKFL